MDKKISDKEFGEINSRLKNEYGIDTNKLFEDAISKTGEPVEEGFRKVAQKIYDNIHGFAQMVIAGGDMHVPMLVNFTSDGRNLAVREVSLETLRDKNFVAFQQRGMAAAGMVSVFISECWMKSLPKDAPVPEGSLKDNHDEEYIQFNIMHKKQRMIAFCKIDRKDGNKLEKAPLQDALDGTRGRFGSEPKLSS